MTYSLPFRLGNVEFKQVLPRDFELWRQQWQDRWVQENHPHHDKVNRFFARLQSQLRSGSVPVGAVRLWAEPVRAVERALDDVERAVAILRYFSMVNFHPLAVSYCAIEGTISESHPYHLLLQDQRLLGSGSTADDWPDRPAERFDAVDLKKMRALGLDHLDTILRLESHQRTPFQHQLLKSLDIYGKASITRDVRDKLLYTVVALESLFVQGREGSLRKKVAERIAYLMGRSVQERRRIIEIYFGGYEMRSNAVHRGEQPADIDKLRDFMHVAWHALNRLIHESSLHKTQAEFLQKIDDIKFT